MLDHLHGVAPRLPPVDLDFGVLVQNLLQNLLLFVVAHHLNLQVLFLRQKVALELPKVLGVDLVGILSNCLWNVLRLVLLGRSDVLVTVLNVLQIPLYHNLALHCLLVELHDFLVLALATYS